MSKPRKKPQSNEAPFGKFKPLSAKQFKRLFEKSMRDLQRSTPNSGLIVGPCRPCCWYHTPIC